MFISHKYQAIFVHIQRTGGTSIQQVFQAMDPDLVKALPVDPTLKRTKHCYASDMRKLLDAHTFATYTKFCVVRNPYDRMLSWYLMLTQGMGEGDRPQSKILGSAWLHKVFKSAKLETRVTLAGLYKRFPILGPVPLALQSNLVGANVMDAVMRQAKTFQDFLLLPRTGANGFFERFYINQLDYVAQNDVLLVDRVLRFETLDQDFAALAQHIGLDGNLGKINQSRREPAYQRYYNAQCRAIVAERFQRDLTFFDYEF